MKNSCMPSNPKKYFCSGLKKIHTREMRHVKKVVSDSLGLVDFAFGLVNFVLNLRDWQVNILGKFKLQKLQLAQMAGCKTDFLYTLLPASRGRCHTSHISPLVILNKYIRMIILFSLTTFKIDFQEAGVTWTTHMSPLVISTSESLSHLA